MLRRSVCWLKNEAAMKGPSPAYPERALKELVEQSCHLAGVLAAAAPERRLPCAAP